MDAAVSTWPARTIVRGLEVRQFEWSPFYEPLLCAGTVTGHVAVVDARGAGRVLGAVRHFGDRATDAVLGICWLRRTPWHSQPASHTTMRPEFYWLHV